MKNYYEILGVSPNVTSDEIRIAYRKLSIKFHPDKNNGDKFFEEWAKKINEAYDILGNQEKRQSYDETLKYSHNDKKESNSSSSFSSDPNHSSFAENEVLKQVRKLTPEFLNSKKELAHALSHYNRLAEQVIPNKFSIARIFLIVILFVISGIGLRKTYLSQTTLIQKPEALIDLGNKQINTENKKQSISKKEISNKKVPLSKIPMDGTAVTTFTIDMLWTEEELKDTTDNDLLIESKKFYIGEIVKIKKENGIISEIKIHSIKENDNIIFEIGNPADGKEMCKVCLEWFYEIIQLGRKVRYSFYQGGVQGHAYYLSYLEALPE